MPEFCVVGNVGGGRIIEAVSNASACSFLIGIDVAGTKLIDSEGGIIALGAGNKVWPRSSSSSSVVNVVDEA